MFTYEKLYEQFHLTPDQCIGLRSLAEFPYRVPPKFDRFIVETVIIEGGERRVMKKEEQGAKLV